jgi:hypothetical protein
VHVRDACMLARADTDVPTLVQRRGRHCLHTWCSPQRLRLVRASAIKLEILQQGRVATGADYFPMAGVLADLQHLQRDVGHRLADLLQPPPGALVQEAQAHCRSNTYSVRANEVMKPMRSWNHGRHDGPASREAETVVPSNVAPPQHSRDAAPARACAVAGAAFKMSCVCKEPYH